ncbi:lantibiotic dehydratase [Rhizobium ruizarguesonis]
MKAILSNHFLVRSGGIDPSEMRSLHCFASLRLMNEIETNFARKNKLTTLVIDALHCAVASASTAARTKLIALKRDVHNNRISIRYSEARHLAKCHLQPADGVNLRLWMALHWRGRRLRRNLTESVEYERLSASYELRKLARAPRFEMGVQLSSLGLSERIQRYTSNAIEVVDEKLERTIYRYLCRAVSKPSPFGSFVDVEVGFLDRRPSGEPDTLVRLNRFVTDCLFSRLRRLPSCRFRFLVKLEPSLRVEGGVVQFFTRDDPDLRSDGRERFVRIRANLFINTVIEAIQNSALLTWDQLALIITNRLRVDRSRVDAELNDILDAGLILLWAGVDERSSEFSRSLSGFLDSLKDALPIETKRLFHELLAAEEKLGRMDAHERAIKLNECSGILSQLVGSLGCAPLRESEIKTLFFEDRVLPTGRCVKAEDIPVDDLAMMASILPAFDEGLIAKIFLADAFVELFGSEAKVPLVEFYRRLKREEGETSFQRRWMAGHQSGLGATLIKARSALAGYLEQRRTLGDEVRLDVEWLTRWVRKLPSIATPWKSSAHYCQRGMGDMWVWNRAGMGYGRQYARFCSDASPTSVSRELSDELRNAYGSNGQLMDLAAVLSLNINLHPNILCYSLAYPRSHVEHTRSIINLGDLLVERRSLGMLSLSTAASGDLILCPLGSLFPALGPPLYRFLSLFAPSLGGGASFWQTKGGDEQIKVFPRLSVGRLIIDRRTVVISVHRIRQILANSDTDALLLLRRLMCALGLGEEAFVRVGLEVAQVDIKRADPATWMEALRRTKARKPVYLDCRCLLAIGTLRKLLKFGSDSLVFQEALPSVTGCGAGERVSEWVFEINIE